MGPQDRTPDIDRAIEILEQRIDAVTHEVEVRRSNVVPVTENSLSKRTGNGQSQSPFELLLERIIQGFHGSLDHEVPENQILSLLHETDDLVCFVGVSGRILSANPAFLARSGHSIEEVNDTPFSDLADKLYRDHILSRINRVSAERGQLIPGRIDDILLFRLRRADGTRFSVEAVAAAVESESDSVALVMRDLSINRNLLDELRESRENYDALSETITEAILRINEDLEIVFANSAVKTTFGFAPDELRGRNFSMLFPESVYRRNEPDFRKYFVVDDQDRRKMGLKNTIEILGNHKNRGVAPMEMSFGNSKDIKGRTLTCIIRDITQRKNAERRLRHLAYHDQLTGLGNRDLFESDMGRLLDTPEIFAAGRAALMFLDLDGFKQVNDTIGHDAGDELLIQTAKRLRKTLRETDSVYRFGGDEFVVLLSFIHDRRGASVVANGILGEIRRPFQLATPGTAATTTGATTTASVGVSIGIAIIPEDGATIPAATKSADLAMYSAKEGGKNRFVYFDQSMDQRANDRWQLEQGIRTSLERQEFRMNYQPLFDSGGIVLGFEGLLRWTHPTHGDVPPSRFIPIAEETGMIVPLGGWAMETAFRDACTWVAREDDPLFVSVNLSPRQFDRSDLVESLGGVIHRTGIDPARIILEVTETCVMNSPERSIATLEAIKDRHPGLSIAIDDFGTGYSSLSYLSRLPADIIKIDISFVSRLFALNNEKIVQAIINLAHSLGMGIIAEGVETVEQRDYFAGKGCLAMQGYHFHRPVATSEIPAILSRQMALASESPVA